VQGKITNFQINCPVQTIERRSRFVKVEILDSMCPQKHVLFFRSNSDKITSEIEPSEFQAIV